MAPAAIGPVVIALNRAGGPTTHRITAALGAGGMGEVWLAKDRNLGGVRALDAVVTGGVRRGP